MNQVLSKLLRERLRDPLWSHLHNLDRTSPLRKELKIALVQARSLHQITGELSHEWLPRMINILLLTVEPESDDWKILMGIITERLEEPAGFFRIALEILDPPVVRYPIQEILSPGAVFYQFPLDEPISVDTMTSWQIKEFLANDAFYKRRTAYYGASGIDPDLQVRVSSKSFTDISLEAVIFSLPPGLGLLLKPI